MEEQRKYAILFAATILAARNLSDDSLKPWGRNVVITNAVDNAVQILEKIDERWPSGKPTQTGQA